jgi:hypothetical protein
LLYLRYRLASSWSVMFAVIFVDRVKFVLEMISRDPLPVRKSQNVLKTNSVKTF